MDSAFIHQAANELVQNVGTRNIKQIARSCSLDISETSRIKDMLGLTSLFSQRQHTAPLQRVVKELPAFLRPCRVQLFHLGAIAALEPERQAGCIPLAVVF